MCGVWQCSTCPSPTSASGIIITFTSAVAMFAGAANYLPSGFIGFDAGDVFGLSFATPPCSDVPSLTTTFTLSGALPLYFATAAVEGAFKVARLSLPLSLSISGGGTTASMCFLCKSCADASPTGPLRQPQRLADAVVQVLDVAEVSGLAGHPLVFHVSRTVVAGSTASAQSVAVANLRTVSSTAPCNSAVVTPAVLQGNSVVVATLPTSTGSFRVCGAVINNTNTGELELGTISVSMPPAFTVANPVQGAASAVSLSTVPSSVQSGDIVGVFTAAEFSAAGATTASRCTAMMQQVWFACVSVRLLPSRSSCQSRARGWSFPGAGLAVGVDGRVVSGVVPRGYACIPQRHVLPAARDVLRRILVRRGRLPVDCGLAGWYRPPVVWRGRGCRAPHRSNQRC